MPVAGNLKMLHDVIQAAMAGRSITSGTSKPATVAMAGLIRSGRTALAAAKNVKRGALIERGVRQLSYTYDMGDDWRHTITVEAVGPPEPDAKYPRFVAGERRCPPEDVGGSPRSSCSSTP